RRRRPPRDRRGHRPPGRRRPAGRAPDQDGRPLGDRRPRPHGPRRALRARRAPLEHAERARPGPGVGCPRRRRLVDPLARPAQRLPDRQRVLVRPGSLRQLARLRRHAGHGHARRRPQDAAVRHQGDVPQGLALHPRRRHRPRPVRRRPRVRPHRRHRAVSRLRRPRADPGHPL
ncbi:MAG: Rare lipoprotein A precursor, partial [uncultured Solirubrobacteraceae bacterium]